MHRNITRFVRMALGASALVSRQHDPGLRASGGWGKSLSREGNMKLNSLLHREWSCVQISLIVLCFALVSLGFSANSFASLVAYYPFNGNANDESGNGNNG